MLTYRGGYTTGAKLPKFSAQLKHVALRSVRQEPPVAREAQHSSNRDLSLQVVFATVGCVFATGEFISASVRQKNDAVNAGVGGALVGVVPAILKKNARLGAAVSLLGGTAMAASTYWCVAVHYATI